MKKKQSAMFSLFIPGVLLGAVIGFIFGSLLVAQMADNISAVKLTGNAAVITNSVPVTP